jgi:hypothetical protein
VVADLVNIWDHPKFKKPTAALGDWHALRSVRFEHEDAPTAVKYAIEKLTGQLIHREPVSASAPALCYSGTSGAGGNPCMVQLKLIAVGRLQYLYELTCERTSPKRWEDETRFLAECDRQFTHWCSQLRVVESTAATPATHASTADALADTIERTLAEENAAAQVLEDPAPVAAVQRQVLDGLRNGMRFFTANKEGGSHLFFDGQVYRRNDFGDEPTLNEGFADDDAIIGCLRRFYNWDAQSDIYPHRKPELAIWTYILGQMRR